MEPMSMNNSNFRLWFAARSILLSGMGLVLLASCSNLGYSPDANSNQQDSAYTSDPEALAAEFSFPQATCGEQATQPSGTWYVVYIDGANPDEVRREYCRDAIGTARDKTGAPTVQVASLTDYSKALKLATAVGGEVETTISNPSTSPSVAASPTSSPTTTNAANTTNSSSGTAYLTATDPSSLINVRGSASTSAPIAHTGRAGDQIRIVEQQQGDDGRTWYKVALQAGQEGWVRSDFVTREVAGNTGSTSTTSGSGNAGSSSTGTTTSGTQPSSLANSNSNYASTTGASPAASSSYSTNDRSTSSSASTSTPSSEQSSSDQYAASTADIAEFSDSAASEDSYVPGDPATLVSDNPGSRINVRGDASTSAQIQHTGYAGDSIQIIDAAEGDDGYTWYQVEFDTGAVGWVRGDLVGGE